MSVKIVIKPNTYFDSVSLMSISTRANKLDGVEQALRAADAGAGTGQKRRPDDCHQRQTRRRQRAVAGGD